MKQIVSEILALFCPDDFVQNVKTQGKFRRICVESLEHNWANISETICPQNANFWQVSVFDVVFSDYLDKFHKLTYFIFMTSSL